MPRVNNPRSDIIRYWRDVELLEPQRIPGLNRKKYVYDVVDGEPLSWEGNQPDGRRKLYKNERWKYTVYCGIYSLNTSFDVLKRYCGDDATAYDARGRGEVALAGFELDSLGHLLADSAVLSSSAWGLGRMHLMAGIHPGWSDGFSNAQKMFTSLYRQYIRTTATPRSAHQGPFGSTIDPDSRN